MLLTPREAYTRSLWAIRSFQRDEQPRSSEVEKPLASVHGVFAGYEGAQVIHGVDMHFHAGRTVAVVGESGSGKSTMARIIAGLLRPTRGEVRFEGRTLAPSYRNRTKEDLRSIQMIYQSADTALNPKQRIREIISWPVQLYLGLRGDERMRRVRELLSLIELDPDIYVDRYPTELSGGQKQRIGIARALAAEPKFIICDEVTSSLDQLVAEGILRLLDRLRAELNLTYMFITHDIATVRAIADDVIVMKDGKVVKSGLKSEVFSPPFEAYTEALLSAVPEMDVGWLDRLVSARRA